ncbi:MAG TPA: hypothetical protein VMR21_14540, partial [Vicinamibacteria bacterium]|nr:hypothetical protein [Vicinamibacteria bacterium]
MIGPEGGLARRPRAGHMACRGCGIALGQRQLGQRLQGGGAPDPHRRRGDGQTLFHRGGQESRVLHPPP